MLPSYNGARKLPNLTACWRCCWRRKACRCWCTGRSTTPRGSRPRRSSATSACRSPRTATRSRTPGRAASRSSSAPRSCARRWRACSRCGASSACATRGTPSPSCSLPCSGAPALRVVNYTHPDYATLLAEFLAASGADAMLMRGTEGEPVADPRRAAALDVYIGGEARADLSLSAQEGVLPPAAAAAAQQRRSDDGALHPVGRQRREAGAAAVVRQVGVPAAGPRRDGAPRGRQACRRRSPRNKPPRSDGRPSNASREAGQST